MCIRDSTSTVTASTRPSGSVNCSQRKRTPRWALASLRKRTSAESAEPTSATSRMAATSPTKAALAT
eukprot:11498236-Heterocapsa_arctica.AAC.1